MFSTEKSQGLHCFFIANLLCDSRHNYNIVWKMCAIKFMSNLYIFLMDLKCVDFVYLLTHTPRGYIIKA